MQLMLVFETEPNDPLTLMLRGCVFNVGSLFREPIQSPTQLLFEETCQVVSTVNLFSGNCRKLQEFPTVVSSFICCLEKFQVSHSKQIIMEAVSFEPWSTKRKHQVGKSNRLIHYTMSHIIFELELKTPTTHLHLRSEKSLSANVELWIMKLLISFFKVSTCLFGLFI